MFDKGHLHDLRAAELRRALQGIPLEGKRVLEIGAGDGYLASLLAEGAAVEAIDVRVGGRSWHPVAPYDGRRIPFADATFDVIFSSNVLEHIPHLPEFHAEMRRVMKRGGVAVHVVPSASWRLFTMLAHYPALPKVIRWKLSGGGGKDLHPGEGEAVCPAVGAALLKVLVAPRHGERGNALTEVFHFTRGAWRRVMERGGWTVSAAKPSRLFYTGYELLGRRLGLRPRRALARLLGSATHILVLKQRAA